MSLFVAGRLNSENVSDLVGKIVFPESLKVYSGSDFSSELRHRLVVTPHIYNYQRTVALVSSRLPRNLSSQTTWFQYLQAVLQKAEHEDLQIVTVPKSTCDRFVQRRKTTHGLKIFEIKLPDTDSFETWLKESLCNPEVHRILISPPIRHEPRKSAINRDSLMLSLARRIHVLKANPKSGTESRVLSLLENHRSPCETVKQKAVYVALQKSLVSSELHRKVHKGNCVAWRVNMCGLKSRRQQTEEQGSQIQDVTRVVDSSDYLFHCTRAPSGPWPGESMEEYLDKLISCREVQRTAIDSLLRIAKQKKILASERLNRTNVRVVSFTHSSLCQIRKMRTFRSHLARWDFEPYGIGVRKIDLQTAFQAQPVIYGDDQYFANLPEDIKPFFQPATTLTKSGNFIHWTEEREWRVKGDIDLSRIDERELLFFVPSRTEAAKIDCQINGNLIVLDELT